MKKYTNNVMSNDQYKTKKRAEKMSKRKGGKKRK